MQVLHEQQLGWDWRPPHESIFTAALPAASSASAKAAAATRAEGEGPGEDGEEAETEEEAAARQGEAEVQERLRDPRYYGALSLLCDEAGFLVDSRARGMLDKLPKDEAGLVKAESVLRAMGVADGSSFEALMDALSADSAIEMRAKGMTAVARRLTSEGRAGTDGGARVPMLVHPDDVVRRLKAFIEVESTSAPARGGMAGAARATGVSRRAAEVEQEFWGRMSQVIGDKGTRVWGVLEKQLEKYRDLLQERSSSLSDVESLQHQNSELRALLNQYLSSRINSELQVPPTVLI